MFTELKAIQSARGQYRAFFRNMAASGMRWHTHRGSQSVVLLQEGATMDVPLPIVLRDVHAMTEETMVNRLTDALRAANAPDVGYLQHGAGTAGPFRTESVRIKHEYADRWLAWFEGKWRRVHVQVRHTYIVWRGQRITIQINGV